MNYGRFEKNVVLVVGAGAGMGEATALQFAKEGANVIALDIFEDRLKRLSGKAEKMNVKIEPFTGDISNTDTVNGVMKLIKNKYGRLDKLAYVAGLMDFMLPPELLDDEIWDRIMDVNVKSVWQTIKAAIPLLKRHEGETASITIVTSLGGYVGSSAGTAYITSKHAAEGLMKNIAFSYRDENIRCNSIAPGGFTTEIQETSKRIFPGRNYEYGFSPEGLALYFGKGILKCIPEPQGDPQYIADAICFLSSNEAKFITGVSLIVDGGWYSV